MGLNDPTSFFRSVGFLGLSLGCRLLFVGLITHIDNLSSVFLELEDYEQAEIYSRRAIVASTRILGRQHLLTLMYNRGKQAPL